MDGYALELQHGSGEDGWLWAEIAESDADGSVQSTRVPHLKGDDDLLQEQQAGIDVLGLGEGGAGDAALGDALTAGEVNEVQLAATHRRLARAARLEVQREHAVAAGRRHVHRSLCDHAVGVAQEEQVQGVLLRGSSAYGGPSLGDEDDQMSAWEGADGMAC